METQTELESRILIDEPKPKRQGPLEGPIKQILESQDRMEANIATLTAAIKPLKAFMDAVTDVDRAPKFPIARFFWRRGL